MGKILSIAIWKDLLIVKKFDTVNLSSNYTSGSTVMKILRLGAPTYVVKVDHHGCRHILTNHIPYQDKGCVSWQVAWRRGCDGRHGLTKLLHTY